MSAYIISGWQADECWDASHREAWAKDDTGQVWHLHQTIPGYGMVARPEPYNRANAARMRMIDKVSDL